MNGKVWNQQQIPVNIYQFSYKFITVFYNDAARNGERTVQPCAVNHAAVALYIESGIVIFYCNFRAFFYFKSGGVTVACHDAKAADAACRNGKCDDGRVIARDKIAAAGGKGPLFFFTKFRKPLDSSVSAMFFTAWKQLGLASKNANKFLDIS